MSLKKIEKLLAVKTIFKNNIGKDLLDKLIEPNTIICFDDFERKSKNIDLNELFGFINQFTLN